MIERCVKDHCDLHETRKKALALKEKGNDAFKKKEYEIAEKLYTEGLHMIDSIKSFEARPLWTNLAICRNILGKHEDALGDSEFALSIDPKCTKAGFKKCLRKTQVDAVNRT